SMRPGIIEAKQESEVKYLRRLKQLYFILFWLSVGVSLLITLAAPYLLPLLFGQQFTDAVIIAQVTVFLLTAYRS
ncbi:MAG: hypothetical protein O7C59_09125, partial [Rickettsia endosymbiont of Ixodes persulcatus]|nr:hypothetical protein [Rickettsia endosymbiont of Ixodes persulcatus]